MSTMDDAEFRAALAMFGKEALQKAEQRGRNAALAAMIQIIRITRMKEETKNYLLSQIHGLRLDTHGQGAPTD